MEKPIASHVKRQSRHSGTGSFDFRFQLSAPKSIPEAAVIQLEVYLATWPPVQPSSVLVACWWMFMVYGCMWMFC